MSLVDTEDLKTMYGSFPKGGTITLWCDSRVEQSDTRKRKKDTDSFSMRNTIEENEAVVEETYQTLLDKHGQKYDTPRLRLWARCICSEQHQSYDNPPALPAFMEPQPKKRKDSLSDALAGAAGAFALVVSSKDATSKSPSVSLQHTGSGQGVSPAKAVELRMKNYEQLRYLQQLFDDGVLTEKEFSEQKRDILDFLRKISS